MTVLDFDGEKDNNVQEQVCLDYNTHKQATSGILPPEKDSDLASYLYVEKRVRQNIPWHRDDDLYIDTKYDAEDQGKSCKQMRSQNSKSQIDIGSDGKRSIKITSTTEGYKCDNPTNVQGFFDIVPFGTPQCASNETQCDPNEPTYPCDTNSGYNGRGSPRISQRSKSIEFKLFNASSWSIEVQMKCKSWCTRRGVPRSGRILMIAGHVGEADYPKCALINDLFPLFSACPVTGGILQQMCPQGPRLCKREPYEEEWKSMCSEFLTNQECYQQHSAQKMLGKECSLRS